MITVFEYLSAIVLSIAVALILIVTGTLVTAFFVAMVAVLIIGVILEGLSSLHPSTKEKGEREEERDGGAVDKE